MSRLVDNFIAYRILNLLVTPFENTDAFRLGIIDKFGREKIKSMADLNTVDERNAYSLLHRLVFRLKRIIEKVPIENKKLASMAAAYALIRESLDKNKEPMDLENRFLSIVKTDLTEEKLLVEQYLGSRKVLTFKQHSEENGAASGVAANNIAATPGISTYSPLMKFKKKKKDMFRRNV